MLVYSPHQGTHSFPAAWSSSSRSSSINFPRLFPWIRCDGPERSAPSWAAFNHSSPNYLLLIYTRTTSYLDRLLMVECSLVSRQGSTHIPPTTTWLTHLSSWPDRHKQRTGLIRPMLHSSLATWIGGLECSHDVILSFSRPHLTTLHPQTSC